MHVFAHKQHSTKSGAFFEILIKLRYRVVFNMVDKGSACAASSSALSLQIEEAKVVSSKDVKSKKKRYSAKRIATNLFVRPIQQMAGFERRVVT